MRMRFLRRGGGARRAPGFTLIELLVAMAVAAILAALAMPAYTGLINKSRAKDAAADLMALSLNLENRFQLSLSYPVLPAGTAATSALFSAWSPTQAHYFAYTLSSSATTYTLTATGRAALAGCVLTLDQANTRSASSACGFTSW